MRAFEYAPIEALDKLPDGPYVDRGDRESALSDALRGVELGAYDERIAAWMVLQMDNSTLRTLVSLFERVRAAGMLDVLAVEGALREGVGHAERPGKSTRISRSGQEERRRG